MTARDTRCRERVSTATGVRAASSTGTVLFGLVHEHLEARFIRYATLAKADAAHAGYDQRNRDNAAYEGIHWNRTELSERFLAFQGRNDRWAPGRTPPAHWLVWLGPALANELGGAKIADATGEAKLTETAAGLAMRAAKMPPAGPAARPDDVGAIPDIARALAPRRISAGGQKNIDYLARWTNIASSRWDNAGPGFTSTPSKLTGPRSAAHEAETKTKAKRKKSFFDA